MSHLENAGREIEFAEVWDNQHAEVVDRIDGPARPVEHIRSVLWVRRAIVQLHPCSPGSLESSTRAKLVLNAVIVQGDGIVPHCGSWLEPDFELVSVKSTLSSLSLIITVTIN